MFSPYRPSDYRGVVDEFLAAQKQRNLPEIDTPSLISRLYSLWSQRLVLVMVSSVSVLVLATAMFV